MDFRVATFNMENLFTRPSAMSDKSGETGDQAILDHAELNSIIAKEVYSAHDQERLLALEQIYRFADLNAPKSALVQLNRVRGQLFRRSRDGEKSVVASGRSSWTGWFELKTEDVKWRAIYNTGRVLAEVNADIVICVEVENRPTLSRFNEQVLKSEFNSAYPHVMVIDGNDLRGIDVGILIRFPITSMASHVDDQNPNGEKTFSRDSPEYLIQLNPKTSIVVIPNHFKSKRGGDSPAVKERRLAQASAVNAIAKKALKTSPYVLIGGDLNDTPDSPTLQPLFLDGFSDVQQHPSYPTDRPGTYDTGGANNKIDYLIMSEKLRAGLIATGIERRGSFHRTLWPIFDTVKQANDEASDHHLVWADFSI